MTPLDVRADADKIVIDLALLENVSKTARTIMRGIRSDDQANAVLLYVKLLNTLYEILYKVCYYATPPMMLHLTLLCSTFNNEESRANQSLS